MKVVRLSASRTGRLYPQEMFLVLIFTEGSRRFRLPDFHDIRHMKVVMSSVQRTGRLYPQEMFLVLIFTRV